jgi:hypothetical protein
VNDAQIVRRVKTAAAVFDPVGATNTFGLEPPPAALRATSAQMIGDALCAGTASDPDVPSHLIALTTHGGPPAGSSSLNNEVGSGPSSSSRDLSLKVVMKASNVARVGLGSGPARSSRVAEDRLRSMFAISPEETPDASSSSR